MTHKYGVRHNFDPATLARAKSYWRARGTSLDEVLRASIGFAAGECPHAVLYDIQGDTFTCAVCGASLLMNSDTEVVQAR